VPSFHGGPGSFLVRVVLSWRLFPVRTGDEGGQYGVTVESDDPSDRDCGGYESAAVPVADGLRGDPDFPCQLRRGKQDSLRGYGCGLHSALQFIGQVTAPHRAHREIDLIFSNCERRRAYRMKRAV